MRTFSEFARDRWGPNWALCRATENNLARYDRCLTQKEYAEAERAWEIETYGAPLKSLTDAAPDLLYALRRCRTELARFRTKKLNFDLELAIAAAGKAIRKAEGEPC